MEKIFHSLLMKKNSAVFDPSFSRPSTQEGRGTWLDMFSVQLELQPHRKNSRSKIQFFFLPGQPWLIKWKSKQQWGLPRYTWGEANLKEYSGTFSGIFQTIRVFSWESFRVPIYWKLSDVSVPGTENLSGISVSHPEEEEKERSGDDGELEHGASNFYSFIPRIWFYHITVICPKQPKGP